MSVHKVSVIAERLLYLFKLILHQSIVNVCSWYVYICLRDLREKLAIRAAFNRDCLIYSECTFQFG